MSCVPRRSSGRTAPGVAAVRAHPLGPGSLGEIGGGGCVVERQDPCPPARRARGRRPPRPPPPTGAGCERRPRRRRAGAGRRERHLDEVVAVEADVHLGPPRRRPFEEAERQVVEELVGQHDARTRQAGQVRQAHQRSGRGRGSDRARVVVVGVAEAGERRGRVGSRARWRAWWSSLRLPTAPRARSAALARTSVRPPARPRQRAGTRTGLDDGNTAGRPASVPPGVEGLGDHRAEQGPTSGLVRKSPRRPAWPPDA